MYISNDNFDFIYTIDKYYSDFGNHGNVTLVLKSKLNDKKNNTTCLDRTDLKLILYDPWDICANILKYLICTR